VRRRLSALVLVVAAALSAPVGARPTPPWSYAASDHFEVFFSGKEQDAREAVALFERDETFFEHQLKVKAGWRPRTRVIVFSSPSDYELYKPESNAAAYWLGTPDGDFIVLQSLDETSPIDAVHELAHMMVARTGTVYPLWIEEGLAQYYSTLKTFGSKVRLGAELPGALAVVRGAAGTTSPDRLFTVTELQPDTAPPLAGQFYAASWALVHMLLTDGAYRGRAHTFLSAVGGGAAPGDAFTATYGKPAAALNADFRKYISRFKVDSTVVAAPPLSTPQIQAGAVDDVDVAVTLGSVLGWQKGHEGEGRAVLEAIEKDAPKRLRLIEARALLEYYTHHCGPAREYLERAVDLGSTNPNVLRLAANFAPTGKAPGPAAAMTPSVATIVMSPCAGM